MAKSPVNSTSGGLTPLEQEWHSWLSFAASGRPRDSRVCVAVNDSVAIDAKRILLRYGAPIAILDNVSEPHRIEFAREIAKTTLPDREPRLKALLIERGYIVVDED